MIKLGGVPRVKKGFTSSVRRVNFGGVANEIKKFRTVHGTWKKSNYKKRERKKKVAQAFPYNDMLRLPESKNRVFITCSLSIISTVQNKKIAKTKFGILKDK